MLIKPCIVIPVYNHEHAMTSMIDEIALQKVACILVDDGSSSSCARLLDSFAEKFPEWITVLRHEKNSGKGRALITGFRYAEKMGYSHALQIDADGQHCVHDIPKFLNLAEKNPTAVITGCPVYDHTVPKKRLYARYLTHIWVWINTLSFTIKDSMCGFRVYPLSSFSAIDKKIKLGHRMEFDSEIIVRLHWDGVNIINVPTSVTYPQNGISHFRLLKDNTLISLMHAKLFFGMLSRKLFSQPKKHWAQINEVTFVAGMRFLFWVYRIGGRTPFRLVLYPVVFTYFVTQPAARRASRNYFTHLHHPSDTKTIFKHFIAFAENILDKLLLWGNLFPLNTVQVFGRECLADNQKRGGLLMCSHTGNLELCRVLSQFSSDIKITVLMHTKHAQAFNRVLAQLNPNSTLNIVEVTEMSPYTAMDFMDKIKAGEFVVIAADRIPVSLHSRTVKAPFLGENADFPIGPYVLAHLLQCPVYLIFSLRTALGAELYFEPFREKIQLPRKNREEACVALATDYAARLAYYCHKAPMQWFNFYDFWSKHP